VKYLLMFIDTEETRRRTPEEMREVMPRINGWFEEHSRAGRIQSGERLQGPETATTVHHGNGTVTMTDGPFVESKESIGGYCVVQVADLDQALALARSWPAGGRVEVRPVWPDDM
jgi:hypothetical protein